MTDNLIKHSHNFVNVIGVKYELLTIKSFFKKIKNHYYYNCICDCGNLKVVEIGNIKSGNTRSCGCKRKNVTSKRSITHNMVTSSEYSTWCGIKRRCLDKNNPAYRNYGGRGIKICDRWLESFENFIEDMGRKPTPKHSIDRIDNNGNYELSNCRWATSKEQNNNKRNNIFITINNYRLLLSEACILHNKPLNLVKNRIRRGWNIIDALEKPIRKKALK